MELGNFLDFYEQRINYCLKNWLNINCWNFNTLRNAYFIKTIKTLVNKNIIIL